MPSRPLRAILIVVPTLLVAGRATAVSLLPGADISGPATIEGRTDVTPGQVFFDDFYQTAQPSLAQDSAASGNGLGTTATASSSANISSAVADVVDQRLVAGVEVPKAAEVILFVVGQFRNEVRGPNANGDFGAMGSLGIVLPEGVSFTASSTPTDGLEIELPAPPAAVLLAGPLGALGATRTRRRRTAASRSRRTRSPSPCGAAPRAPGALAPTRP
jgi:hypothetical protein